MAPAESAVISIAGEEGAHGLQPTDVNLNSDPNGAGPVADGPPDGEDPPPDMSLCPYCGKKSEITGAWCLSCQEDLHCPRIDPSDSEIEDGSPPRPTGGGHGPNSVTPVSASDRINSSWGRTKEVGKVVFIRLTKQSLLITNTVLSFPGLRKAIIRVNANGCNVSPWWANGGMVLFPYDIEDLDNNGQDIGFKRENVVISASDFNNFCLALLEIPETERPGLYLEDHRSILDELLDSDDENESNHPPAPPTGEETTAD